MSIVGEAKFYKLPTSEEWKSALRKTRAAKNLTKRHAQNPP